MDVVLARNWWAVLIRGIAAVLFGLLAIIWPGLTLSVLIFLFGFYALLDGVLAIAGAIRAVQHHGSWVLLLVEGILGIVAGLIAFFYPGETALVLLYIIAFWAIVTGIMEIVAAVALRRAIANEIFLIIAGVLSVLFGIILIVNPGAGALSVIFVIGVYAIIFGISLIALALRLRGRTEIGGRMTPRGV